MTDEDHPQQPTTISRDDLYAQAWAEPMSRLANRYKISGTGLAKICRRLDIPYPPRGHWARKAAGKKVSQTPLPALREGTPAQATIAPSLPAPPAPQLSKELEEALTAAARRFTAGLTVPERLLRPHPIIASWIEERRRRREEAKRDPWYRRDLALPDFEPIQRRRHRILSALFTALEQHGYAAKVDPRGAPYVEIDREPAQFTLKEKYRQVRRPLTDEEKRQGFNPKRPWRQEMQPTGLLQLSIETRLDPALIQAWIDTPEQLLEHQLPEIAAVFLVAAPILRERRRLHDEAEKRRREDELRRYQERQDLQQDQNRWRSFLEFAGRWKEAENARQFLDALVARAESTKQAVVDGMIDQWIAWARDRIAAHDPLLTGPDAIFQSIAAVDPWTYRDDWRG